jgi:hypothetical protein
MIHALKSRVISCVSVEPKTNISELLVSIIISIDCDDGDVGF